MQFATNIQEAIVVLVVVVVAVVVVILHCEIYRFLSHTHKVHSLPANVSRIYGLSLYIHQFKYIHIYIYIYLYI